MTTALVRGRAARAQFPASRLVLAGGRQHTAETILRAWFESKSPHTIAAYKVDLEEFALFVSRALGLSPVLTVPNALRWFFQQSAPSANEVVLLFRAHLERAGMAPSSINRHLAALRSLTALGRMLGALAWSIDVPGVKAEPRRDTRGPDPATVRAVLDAIDVEAEHGARDAAIILLLYGLALRAAELCRLDRADLRIEGGTVWVLGKGRREKVLLQMPAPTVAACARYLQFRGTAAGPLFQALQSRAHGRHNRVLGRGGRLETRSILRIVRTRGAAVRVKLWCHALRHAAITVAIEKGQQAGIGLDQIRHFSRHKSVTTMMLYRDERDQAQTQETLAAIVGAELTKGDV